VLPRVRRRRKDLYNQLPPSKELSVPISPQAVHRSLLQLTTASLAIALFVGCGDPNAPLSGPIVPDGSHTSHKKGVRLSQNGVVVDPSHVGVPVSTAVLGAGMGVWHNITLAGIAQSFVTAGLTTTRWPGGKAADRYHWLGNTYGSGICSNSDHPNAESTFDNFMADVAVPAHLDVAMTVNYGSNAQCTGSADPTEASAWVAYANAKKSYNLTWWTVGNEQYTKGSLDLRSQPHNPTQYAQVVSADYYQQMKAASSVPINVCVDANPKVMGWDATVFSETPFDCAELHYYPQGTTVNDQFLINNAAPDFTAFVQKVQGELVAAGHRGTPIYLGEIGSTNGVPGKQTMSITQALYAGQIIGEMLNDGVARATWHIGYGACDPPSKGGDFSKSLYGWQNYGGAMIFSEGAIAKHCGGYNVPRGALLATADVFEVASHFAKSGEHILGASVTGMPDVRAYATTYSGGYALMVFNLNATTPHQVPVVIDGKSSGSGGPIWT
jgi:hypothetical protein